MSRFILHIINNNFALLFLIFNTFIIFFLFYMISQLQENLFQKTTEVVIECSVVGFY